MDDFFEVHILDHNEILYAEKILNGGLPVFKENVQVIGFNSLITKINEIETKANETLKEFKKTDEIKHAKKLLFYLKSLYGTMLLIEIFDAYNPYSNFITKTEFENLLNDLRKLINPSTATKYKKWSIDEKGFIGVMIENDIKPNKYAELFNVSKDSLYYQIKKIRQGINEAKLSKENGK